MNSFRLTFIVFLFISGNCLAQTESDAIKAVIDQLFDGMRKGDSAMVHRSFVDDVQMQTIVMSEKNWAKNVITSSLTSFLDAVGTPHAEVWDEQVKEYKITIDGALAAVWTPYEFYRGDTFSHCGVNSFQLAKLNGEWKIIYLVDTRKREGCS